MLSLIAEFAKEHGGLSADVIRKAFNATEEEFCHLVKRFDIPRMYISRLRFAGGIRVSQQL